MSRPLALRRSVRSSAHCTAEPCTVVRSGGRERWGDELPPAPELSAMPRRAGARLRPLAGAAAARPPAQVRAIYVNAWAFGGRRLRRSRRPGRPHRDQRLRDRREGRHRLPDVPLRRCRPRIQIGANTQLRARDYRGAPRLLREHGIHPIARIVVAKDPLLASRKPEWSVRHVNGGLWHDRLDFAWVDAFNDSVWIYAAQLAAEAVRHRLRRGAVRLRALPR